MKIYTKTGDGGETGLFGGSRVPKSHPRVAAYGDVDELNAAIGVAAATTPRGFEARLLESIQRDLFAVGAQLASPKPEKVAKALVKARLDPARVTDLERAIDRLERTLPALRAFVLPGGTPKAAQLHLARTVCRRAERAVIALIRGRQRVPSVIPVYLNRLSDLLFVLARAANRRGRADRVW